MKGLLIAVVALGVCGLCPISLGGHAYFTGDTWIGRYKFDVPTDERDRWNSAVQDAPPLLPGKAIRIAKEFVHRVPLYQGWDRWEVAIGGVSLYRLSTSEAQEEWVYVIRFIGIPKGPSANPPYPEVNVPVRMDGTIPRFVVEK